MRGRGPGAFRRERLVLRSCSDRGLEQTGGRGGLRCEGRHMRPLYGIFEVNVTNLPPARSPCRTAGPPEPRLPLPLRRRVRLTPSQSPRAWLAIGPHPHADETLPAAVRVPVHASTPVRSSPNLLPAMCTTTAYATQHSCRPPKHTPRRDSLCVPQPTRRHTHLPDHRQWLSTAHGWSRPVVTRSTLIDARSFRLGVPSPFLPDGHQKLEMPSPCCSLPSIPGDAILHWVCASLLHSTVLPQITDSLLHHVCHGHAVVDNAEYGFLGSLGLPFTYVMP